VAKELKDYLYYEEENPSLKIYCGDCAEIMPLLPKVDLVVTDPPYGVGVEYQDGITDNDDLIKNVVIPVIQIALANSKRVIITPGTRCAWLYPRPDEMGCLYFPAGNGFSRWGFTCFQPILYYGKDPYPTNKSANSRSWTELSEKNDHPCPKPLKMMKWLVKKGSLDNETILDPFLGSGTTLVACKELKRNGIGIEINEKYCEIAKKRLQNTQRMMI
jgi:site-specific DNA-methyltransferase (adenine-specific)